jgi:hypothetical protein
LWQPINGNQSLKKGRIRLQEFSTVVLYGQRKFCSNSARFCAKPCERATIGLPSVSGAMQHYENVWKTSLVNYKSAALPASYAGADCEGNLSPLNSKNPAHCRTCWETGEF